MAEGLGHDPHAGDTYVFRKLQGLLLNNLERLFPTDHELCSKLGDGA
jgi:hypothetical protein